MLLLQIALLGGMFAVLGFIHFFVDWIFQSSLLKLWSSTTIPRFEPNTASSIR